MKFSTRGRYALRVMVDLAEHAQNAYTPMKSIAERQGISLKYLEQIVPILTKNNLVKGIHGKGGGYCLTRDPALISVGEILRLTEGDLAPITCLECQGVGCDRKDSCRTLSMWLELQAIITNYLDNVTISSLVKDGPDRAKICLSDDSCL